MMHDGGGDASTHVTVAHTDTMNHHVIAFIDPFSIDVGV